MASWKEQRKQWHYEQQRKQELAEQQRLAEKKARDDQNRVLKANGYNWSKEYSDTNRQEYECGVETWVLRSPDGRKVSVSQAMAEINNPKQTEVSEVVAVAEVVSEAVAAAEVVSEVDNSKQAEFNNKLAQIESEGRKPSLEDVFSLFFGDDTEN